MNRKILAIKKKLWTPRDRDDIPPLGTRETLASWFSEDADGEDSGAPLYDMVNYGKLLQMLPDKVVENLEKARLSRDGRVAAMKAGLGYEELLGTVIVDGTAIASSATEAMLFPALLVPANYMQPGSIPGRTIRWRARGRMTTLTTAATLIFNFGSAATNVIPTTSWAKSGALVMDTTAQTNTQWLCEGEAVVRSVGSAGTIFTQGWANTAGQAFTLANAGLQFMGSGGSTAPAAITVDWTTNFYMSLTGKWSLSTAYSIQGHVYTVEALN